MTSKVTIRSDQLNVDALLGPENPSKKRNIKYHKRPLVSECKEKYEGTKIFNNIINNPGISKRGLATRLGISFLVFKKLIQGHIPIHRDFKQTLLKVMQIPIESWSKKELQPELKTNNLSFGKDIATLNSILNIDSDEDFYKMDFSKNSLDIISDTMFVKRDDFEISEISQGVIRSMSLYADAENLNFECKEKVDISSKVTYTSDRSHEIDLPINQYFSNLSQQNTSGIDKLFQN